MNFCIGIVKWLLFKGYILVYNFDRIVEVLWLFMYLLKLILFNLMLGLSLMEVFLELIFLMVNLKVFVFWKLFL